MSEGGTGGTSSKLAKGLGGLTIILGGMWVVNALWPLVKVFSGETQLEDAWFMFGVVPIVSVPGAFAILSGYQILREVNLPNIKVLVGVYAAFGALAVFAGISRYFSALWQHQRMPVCGLTFGMAVFGLLIYLLLLRGLLPVMGMKWDGCRSVLGKGAFILLAWLLWQALFAVAQELIPTSTAGAWWDLIALFGPILVAWKFYDLAMKWLKADQTASTNPLP